MTRTSETESVHEELEMLRAENLRLREIIRADRTGLAAGLVEVIKNVERWSWMTEGRGSYEWNDDRYRDELGRAFTAILAVATDALHRSGERVNDALHGARGDVQQTLPGAGPDDELLGQLDIAAAAFGDRGEGPILARAAARIRTLLDEKKNRHVAVVEKSALRTKPCGEGCRHPQCARREGIA